MNRYLCIHGHFYQPPRENPWLEEVELQDSAYPYHDWNERITLECYAPNTAARILGPDRKITRIENNYGRISFNFGPTLLSWMARRAPDTYARILQADEASRRRFSGHGAALAQAYNHIIMPLAHPRDKRTQVLWGIADFVSRFGRRPEGMWLPETAVDLSVLDIMAEAGIRFTILSPYQARRVRRAGERTFTDVGGGRIDIRRPYLCRLPSGRTIALFFYDGPVAQDIAFGGLLRDGDVFVRRLTGLFTDDEAPQIVHAATDGETYGHHHKRGDMALAYALHKIETSEDVRLTVYGEYLERFPPRDEVEIFENTSWSCAHGIERWHAACGCGARPGWHLEWRAPLRGALDWLRDNLALIYEERMAAFVEDPWAVRDAAVEVILDRSPRNVTRFIRRRTGRSLPPDEFVRFLTLLEIQRHAMLMFTSCGWFFDDVSRIETVQILQYAARAMQLASTVSDLPLEASFLEMLARAPSNVPEYGDAAGVYERCVRPAVLDLVRVGAHYAVSSLFEEYPQQTTIYCYTARARDFRREESGKHRLAVGRARIRSRITWQETEIMFAALHLGDHNLMGGVAPIGEGNILPETTAAIRAAFLENDIARTIREIEERFPEGHYSLWHLFKDEQRKVLYQVLDTTLEEVKASLRRINEHHYPIIQVIRQLRIPLPKILANTVVVMLNTDLLQVVGTTPIDFDRLERLVAEVRGWELEIDKVTLGFLVRRRIDRLMDLWASVPERTEAMEAALRLLSVLKPLNLDVDLWHAQNVYVSAGGPIFRSIERGIPPGWIETFQALGELLGVRIE